MTVNEIMPPVVSPKTSTKIWHSDFHLDYVNSVAKNTCAEYLNIQFTEYGDDYLVATMPVNEKTVQPIRILHGGMSVLLAETVGSTASILCVDMGVKTAVGVSVNASHLRPAYEGSTVTAICKPIRLGRTMHVWDVKVRDEKDRLICICRLTMAVVNL